MTKSVKYTPDLDSITEKALITGCEYGYAAYKIGNSLDEAIAQLLKLYKEQERKGDDLAKAWEENKECHNQIDKLAKFIMENIPGEPSQSEGAVECAIRIMRKSQ